MKTLYVRIKPKLAASRFYRCGIEFGRDWKQVGDLDAATAQRLEEEQMLEVTDTRPAELDETAAGDSAETIVPPVDIPVPPADAPASDDLASALMPDADVLATGEGAVSEVPAAPTEAVAEVAPSDDGGSRAGYVAAEVTEAVADVAAPKKKATK